MSDSVSKYYDMLEEGLIDPVEDRKPSPSFPSEGDRKLAYKILVEYPEEAIVEAARILKYGK